MSWGIKWRHQIESVSVDWRRKRVRFEFRRNERAKNRKKPETMGRREQREENSYEMRRCKAAAVERTKEQKENQNKIIL